jgi:type I restriction enzyme S subunit
MPGLDATFCWWWLHSAIPELRAEATGSTYEAVTAEEVGALRVPNWAPAVQRAIADFLDTETARIDALITKKRRMINLLEARWTSSVCSTLLPDGPGSGIGRSDDLTSGWRRQPLRRLLESTWGGDWGDEPGDGDLDLPCVRAADFEFGRLEARSGAPRSFSRASISVRALRPGELVLEKSGGGEGVPVGRVVAWRGDGPALPTNFAGGMRPAPGVDPDFLLLVFRAAYELGLPWRSIKQTTGLQNLDTGHYLSHHWPVPPLDKQRRLASELLAELDRVRTLQAKLQHQIALLREHRQALITAAVTGELEVPGVAA